MVSLCALNRVSEVRAVVTKLLKLIVREPLMLFAQLPSIAILVCSPEPEPEEAIDASAEGNHAERNGVATDEAWFVKRWARLWLLDQMKRMYREMLRGTHYIKADMIPDALPKVSCIPVAVVLLPYRGVLFGNYSKMLVFSPNGYPEVYNMSLPMQLEDRQRRRVRMRQENTQSSALQVTYQTTGRHIRLHLSCQI